MFEIRGRETMIQERIAKNSVHDTAPLKLKLVLFGKNVVSALSLSSSNWLRCNYGGQLSDDVIFVLTQICY